jgi:translocation and assembly module TamB
LGDHVNLKYRGLNAALQGTINISGVPGSPLTATGEFSIAKDSKYKAYGRQLLIQQGQLIYAGNLLTNPGISLRATQQVKSVGFTGTSQFQTEDFKPVYSGSDTITVGIAVSGTLDKPAINLFSDPAGLSQGDILSYMLFGYPQAQATGASGLALLNAASDMVGGTDKKNIVNNLQQSLGLDELSVGSTEYYDMKSDLAQNTTTVNVGRNLGHKLSLHYSVGLFQPVQVFSLRYQINRHLVLQTETSTLENGGDLMYQLESRE